MTFRQKTFLTECCRLHSLVLLFFAIQASRIKTRTSLLIFRHSLQYISINIAALLKWWRILSREAKAKKKLLLRAEKAAGVIVSERRMRCNSYLCRVHWQIKLPFLLVFLLLSFFIYCWSEKKTQPKGFLWGASPILFTLMASHSNKTSSPHLKHVR